MIIGLHGKAQAGKDTSANFIEEYFEHTPLKIERRSFAFSLKESAVAALGIEVDDPIAFCDLLKTEGASITTSWYDDEAMNQRSKRITGREFLQNYGTEAHRAVFGSDFWVDACLPKSQSINDDYESKLVIVTDVRFPNEAERIHNLGGYVWEVERPEIEKGDAHASEQRLPDAQIDATIHNAGTLDDLRASVRRLLTEVLGRQLGNSGGPTRFEDDYSVDVDSLPGSISALA
jgi:hypothetical protein